MIVRVAFLAVSHLATRGSASSACDAPEPLVLPIKDISTTNEPIVKWGLGLEIGSPGQWIEAHPGPEWNNTSVWPELDCGSLEDGICSWRHGDYFEAEDSESWAETRGENTYENPPADGNNLRISPWGTDDVTLSPSITLPEFPLWTLSKGDKPHNQLGLGRNSSFVDALLKAGEIASNTWSLWWGWHGTEESHRREGSLMLGGYDKAKTGGDDKNRYTQDISPGPGCPSGLIAQVRRIMVNQADGQVRMVFGSQRKPLEACIKPDSGLIHLPRDERKQLEKILPAKSIGPSRGIYSGGMSYDPKKQLFDGNISFVFLDGPTITIPNHQLSRPHIGINANNEPFEIDRNRTLMVADKPANTTLLGQPFLAAAYLNVDHEISKFTLWNAVPTSDVDLVTVDHASEPSTCEVGGDSSATSTPGQDAGGSLSGGAIAGIVVGCVAGVALMAALIFFVWRRKQTSVSKDKGDGELPEGVGLAPPAQLDGKEKAKEPNELDSGQGHVRTAEMQAVEPPAMELPGDNTFPETETQGETGGDRSGS